MMLITKKKPQIERQTNPEARNKILLSLAERGIIMPRLAVQRQQNWLHAQETPNILFR
jgi:hypothetical protein